ncbi:MAG TPA: PEGA domain-containing protein, partial [Kofleriaceae bacterium]|nr:PEGA domain-containing protein [Kofleriaceae bacterium]
PPYAAPPTTPPVPVFSLPPARYGYDENDRPRARNNLVLTFVIAVSAAAIVLALVLTRSPGSAASPDPSARPTAPAPATGSASGAAAAIVPPTDPAPTPTPAPTPAVDPAPTPTPIPTPPEETAERDDPDDEEPATGPAPAPVAPTGPPPPGMCRVTLTVTPPDAQLRINGRAAAAPSGAHDVPCGRVKLDLARTRYAPLERTINVAGADDQLTIDLRRPEHTLRIVSTPGGATVIVDGRQVGVTPVNVKVAGFTSHKIEVRRAGFRTFRTTVYSRKPTDVVATRLTKGQ